VSHVVHALRHGLHRKVKAAPSDSAPFAAERSLIQLGPSLALTIPKEWAEKHKVSRGSKVRVVEDGSALRVEPG
jgi:hypothetical protein